MNSNKIKVFISDTEMKNVVKQYVKDKIVKSEGSNDVNYLAAKMIALEIVDKVWKEMEKVKYIDNNTEVKNGQIGL